MFKEQDCNTVQSPNSISNSILTFLRLWSRMLEWEADGAVWTHTVPPMVNDLPRRGTVSICVCVLCTSIPTEQLHIKKLSKEPLQNKIAPHIPSSITYMCMIFRPDTQSCDSTRSSWSYSEGGYTGDSHQWLAGPSLSSDTCEHAATRPTVVESVSSSLDLKSGSEELLASCSRSEAGSLLQMTAAVAAPFLG